MRGQCWHYVRGRTRDDCLQKLSATASGDLVLGDRHCRLLDRRRQDYRLIARLTARLTLKEGLNVLGRQLNRDLLLNNFSVMDHVLKNLYLLSFGSSIWRRVRGCDLKDLRRLLIGHVLAVTAGIVGIGGHLDLDQLRLH